MSDVTPVMPTNQGGGSENKMDAKIRGLRDMRNDIVFNAPPDLSSRAKNTHTDKDMEELIIDALKRNHFLKDFLSEAGECT